MEPLEQKINDLLEKLDNLSQKQDSQFTEIMMHLKEYVKLNDEKRFIDKNDPALYEEAKEIVQKSGKASTSWLQRKLGIGYSRAAHLVDLLEQEGVVGPANGSVAREVYKNDNKNKI